MDCGQCLPHTYRHSQKLEEGAGCPGTGVPGGWEKPSRDSGNQTWFLWKSSKYSKPWKQRCSPGWLPAHDIPASASSAHPTGNEHNQLNKEFLQATLVCRHSALPHSGDVRAWVSFLPLVSARRASPLPTFIPSITYLYGPQRGHRSPSAVRITDSKSEERGR